ncbi:cyclohexanecarboxyl-CoA dehydrogenase [Rhodococcus opacus PD630]|uniref:acyl-CoA dehydrogenase family protein n=1 Tax=Rhodococcus opacus TaxID=37919 RepID=UPI00029CCD57|nr:acyl-CoA dehydrogenase family protein [Rhodococcus opacus]KXF49203.1 acyl-CoA dehydrogenase [Rhodococcus sp. SC4]RZK71833.1 MAG: acyl-CoA dehydrogenase [Rhodococcus sp. (in: high G+C Gram-positive bacteria)]AHK27377.1 cyclohexanecarboxyl-CoA dehydrogenase [Rhodococcus opacus PD630]EHI47613.1 cyclohexanecarboxyl-CoA dehydrogenase [Rhodococcus opacus PD630]UDG97379.1 acyl-CoA dehydrogenase family protein [Rhodococcus opacus PD630]
MKKYVPSWHDEEVKALSDLAAGFFEREVVAHNETWDAQHRIDRSVWLEAGKLGLLCCSIPAEYGGGGGSFAHDLAVFDAQGYAGDLSFGISVHSGIVAHYILEYGTEEQKTTWLPGMATGDILGAIGMTEPGAGSDLKAIKTIAVRDGDDYIVNGSKTFITNGASADMIVLAVKTDPKAGAKGVALLIVDLRDCPGFTVGRVLDKVGQHGADTSELSFTDVRVPVTNLLGQEGQGFGQLIAQLVQERLIIGAQAAGAMRRAVEDTVDYTKSRQAFGHSLLEFQNTAFELAECQTIARTCEVFLDHCISEHLAGQLDPAEAAMVKYWLTEQQCSVIDRCVQLHGGYGYMREYLIARMYEDARVQKIYAGANEVMKSIIARAL